MAVNVQTFLQTDVQIAFSKLLDAAVNTPYLLAADFETALINQINALIPIPETVNDDDQVGDGSEFSKGTRNYYWGQTPITVQCKLNTEIAARLFKRFLAGTQTDPVVVAGVWDHNVAMQTRQQGTVPQPFTVAVPLGGADFIYSSMFVNSCQFSQAQAAEPTAQFEIVGTGYHKRFSDVFKILSVTMIGPPTGGTFTITFVLNGTSYTTAPIVYNATAAVVATAIITAATLAVGDIVGSGGPLPGTAVTLTIPSTSNIYDDVIGAPSVNGALLVGAGAGVTIAPSTPLLVLPDPPAYHYMHGAALTAVTNDGAPLDLTQFGLLGHTITMRQNITFMRFPGDNFMKPGNVFSGAYPYFARRGRRESDVSMKLLMGADLREYKWFRKQLDITDLIFTHNGPPIGATAFNHQFEYSIPFSKPRTLVGDSEGQYAAKTITLAPTRDPVTLGIVKGRIRNGNATLV